MNRFDGRVVLVTGAARGIGRATARRFATDGATVVLSDVDDSIGESVTSELSRQSRVAYAHLDVSRLDDWSRVAEMIRRQYGRLDVVHNNAYSVVRGSTHELSEADWDHQIDVCLKQVFLSVKTCMPLLLKTGGTMVNTSSVHAVFGLPRHAAYDAAKGGMSALTRQLAAEYGPKVRVNAVIVGGVLTDSWNESTEEDRVAFAASTPLGRLGEPEEIASVVCFLASDDATYITGENVVVDGGWTITK